MRVREGSFQHVQKRTRLRLLLLIFVTFHPSHRTKKKKKKNGKGHQSIPNLIRYWKGPANHHLSEPVLIINSFFPLGESIVKYTKVFPLPLKVSAIIFFCHSTPIMPKKMNNWNVLSMAECGTKVLFKYQRYVKVRKYT